MSNSRITDHANRCNLFSPIQSAYHRYHFTETALIKIHSDLFGIVSIGHATLVGVIALLSLSSVFDTAFDSL